MHHFLRIVSKFFSNEQQYTPFVKTNILKGYLQYIGIYKSIESYTLVHDFNPKSKLEKNCFLKHIAGNSYIIYKTKNEGILWGDYRYSLLSKGQPTIKIILKIIQYFKNLNSRRYTLLYCSNSTYYNLENLHKKQPNK